MKHRSFIKSLQDAFQGFIFVVRNERNMGFHVFAAALAIAASLYYRLERVELLFVFTAIFLVFLTEMFNTALETLVDLQTREYHPLAKIAKRVAAGAVLCAAIYAVVVAYLVFGDKIF